MKTVRKMRGFSQRKLAEESKLSFSMVSKLESGEQSNPSLETIDKIAKALKTTPYFLLMESGKLDQLNQVSEEVRKDIERAEESGATYTNELIHALLTSEKGAEYFQINHAVISPDEFDNIKEDILKYIEYCFSKYRDKD